MNKKKTLVFHCDPGHGWLETSLPDIIELGLKNKISRYSYITTDGTIAETRVFLEEDCDAPLFLGAAKAAGWEISMVDEHTDQDS